MSRRDCIALLGETAPETLRSKVGDAEGRRKGGLPPSEWIEKGVLQ